MANVGFFDRVRNAIIQLTSGRSNADKNDGTETPGPNKRVRVYEITPGRLYSPKQIETVRVKRDFYTFAEIISVTEDRNYEFKAGGMFLNSNHLADYINKYGSAFLNSEGGVLIGGVLDNGVVKGMVLRHNTQEWLRTMIKKSFDSFRPRVSPDCYRLNFVPVMDGRPARGHYYNKPLPLENCYVLEIHIRKGDVDEIYETSNHKIFIRRDGGVQGPLRPLQIREVVLAKYKQKLKLRQKDSNKANPQIKRGRLESIKEDNEEEEVLKEQAKDDRPSDSKRQRIENHQNEQQRNNPPVNINRQRINNYPQQYVPRAHPPPQRQHPVYSPIVFDIQPTAPRQIVQRNYDFVDPPRPQTIPPFPNAVQRRQPSNIARGFNNFKQRFRDTFSRR